MTIEEIVAAELALTAPLPALITLDIERVTQQVKNYCHLSVLPLALSFTIADMVVDLQRVRTGENITISRVSMGDTDYTLTTDTAIDGLVRNYRANLNAFRRVAW